MAYQSGLKPRNIKEDRKNSLLGDQYPIQRVSPKRGDPATMEWNAS